MFLWTKKKKSQLFLLHCVSLSPDTKVLCTPRLPVRAQVLVLSWPVRANHLPISRFVVVLFTLSGQLLRVDLSCCHILSRFYPETFTVWPQQRVHKHFWYFSVFSFDPSSQVVRERLTYSERWEEETAVALSVNGPCRDPPPAVGPPVFVHTGKNLSRVRSGGWGWRACR